MGLLTVKKLRRHVSDEKQMQKILERLGFVVYFAYEKFRSVSDLMISADGGSYSIGII
jgi:adenylate cyclase class IV